MTDFDKGRTRSRNRMGVVVTVLVMAVVFSLLALKTTRADSIPTYYIAPNGSDSNDGSSANPYKTFAKALTRITDKQGGTIYFKGSTDEDNPYVYQEHIVINKSGKDSNNSLIVGGEPGKYAAIDGKNHILGDEWGGLIQPEGDYLRVENLEVRKARSHCINTKVESGDKRIWFNNITIDNCRVHSCGNSGIQLRYVDYAVIENCDVWNCNDDESNPHPGATGIHNSTNGIIRKNIIHETYTEGTEMRDVKKGVIEDNIIYQTRNGALLIDRCQEVIAQRNFIFSDPADPGGFFRKPGSPANGITIGVERNGRPGQKSENNTVINNIVVHQNKGFQAVRRINPMGTGGLVNCLVANNTFVDMYNDTPGNSVGGRGIDIVIVPDHGLEIRDSIIKNNIIIQSKYGGVLHRGETSGITWSNNCWDDGSGGKPTAGARGDGDVYDSAGLLDAAHAFVDGRANVDWYKLSSNSKCKDAGADIASITEDYWGNSRPYGNKYDVGAHEFGGTSSPTNPPTGTTLIFSFKPEGMVNPPSLLGTKVEAIKDGQGTPQVITASYLTDGEYEGEISGLSLGTYTVIVKPERHLSEKFEGISITEGSNEYDFTDTQYGARFLAGDISGADGSPNNKVDIYDIALVVNDFDEEGDAADLTADVDYDGIVGGLDLTYIISSFDEEGE